MTLLLLILNNILKVLKELMECHKIAQCLLLILKLVLTNKLTNNLALELLQLQEAQETDQIEEEDS